MQSELTKIYLIICSLGALHATSFASTTTLLSPDDNANVKMRNLHDRVSTLEHGKAPCGLVNPPVRPLVEDYDFNLFGDLLLWQAHEDGLPLAVKNTATNFATGPAFLNFQNSEVERLDFDYNAGFRVGVDFDMPHDGWDTSLTWLRLGSTAKQSGSASGTKELFASRVSPNIAAFINSTTPPSLIYAHMHAHWKCFLNQLDLDMGREFFVSRWVTLRPHFGLRSTWIRQRLATKYNTGIANVGTTAPDIDVHEKNKWWGLGLEGGLDTRFRLGCGFSLYGALAAAIEYGFQKLHTVNEIEPTEVKYEKNRDSFRMSRPILDLQAGLNWDHTFADGRYNFGLHAGWEHHVYFSQNQFHNDMSYGQVTTNQGDLTYQGWTFGAHLAL